jgi:hypothetical protein
VAHALRASDPALARETRFGRGDEMSVVQRKQRESETSGSQNSTS